MNFLSTNLLKGGAVVGHLVGDYMLVLIQEAQRVVSSA